jgi:hypothetical protein
MRGRRAPSARCTERHSTARVGNHGGEPVPDLASQNERRAGSGRTAKVPVDHDHERRAKPEAPRVRWTLHTERAAQNDGYGRVQLVVALAVDGEATPHDAYEDIEAGQSAMLSRFGAWSSDRLALRCDVSSDGRRSSTSGRPRAAHRRPSASMSTVNRSQSAGSSKPRPDFNQGPQNAVPSPHPWPAQLSR